MPKKKEVVPEEVSSVYDANGNFVRSYSSEIHGEDYAALARQFADKIKGSVK